MLSKESAQKEIQRLVTKFNHTSHTNESNTELKWIEPLMKALGWNMESDDVSKRDQLGVNYSDYTFKLKGHRQFVLEAKGIGVHNGLDGKYEHKTFAEQALDYARHSDCTWAILTDFNEFRLYSVDKKEDNGLVFKIRYNQYATEEFEQLWLLSKASISRNELNIFGEKWGFKKKKVPIDKILLNDLLHFREILSKDVLKHNQYLLKNIDLCDETVQKILDRLIFIRNCEDTGIESDRLIALVDSKGIYKKLKYLFTSKDKYGYYNSSLFAINECDKPDFNISDNVLSEVIQGLYQSRENSFKYHFSEIDSDVLGSMYEQYLGHLLKRGKQGGLDENFAKKKKQGIYYTPLYIVDYIIKHTLGKVLEGKTKNQIKNIKVLDMACGSGSFLIKCYDLFESAYLDIKAHKKDVNIQLKFDMAHEDRKSIAPNKRCEIIENNIYGVDLDKQAVEISQLNLVLKIKHKVRLPFTNIICGNSLLENKESSASGVFEQFSNAKKQNFDVIVGNPPYVDIKDLDNIVVKQLFDKYTTVENRMNLYSVFVEKSLHLLKDGGYFGFIIPNSILYNSSYAKIRKMLLDNVCLKEIVRLPDNVFEDVKVETIILIYQKDKKQINRNTTKVLIYKADDTINHIGEDNCYSNEMINQNDWIKDGIINLKSNKSTSVVLEKIEKNFKPLAYYCDFCLGLTPYDAYKGHSKEDIKNKIFHSDTPKTQYHKPLLKGGDITRYAINWGGGSYIKYGAWLGAPRDQRFFTEPRILVRQIISGVPARIYAGYSNKEYYNPQSAFNILIKDMFKKEISIKYILAVMNSNLITYYHREKFLDATKVLFQKILIANAKKFPIPIPAKEQQAKIEVLVDEVITLEGQLYRLGDEISDRKAKIQRQIEIINENINKAIYKVYDIPNPKIGEIESTFNIS